MYRELFYFFTWRDIKVKYKHTALGIIWAILQPLSLMLIFTFVFSKGLKLQSGQLPYQLFVLSGLTIWQLFSGGLSNAANSILSNSKIIQKIYFPRIIIPISAILAAVFDYFFSLAILVLMAIYYGLPVHFVQTIFLLFVSLILAILATSGLSLLLSAWNVKYRDFQYAIPFFIQILFFLSPVIYESNQFKGTRFEILLKFNPMCGPIHLSRAAFSGLAIDWQLIIFSLTTSLILLLAGVYIFRNMEQYFADLA